MLSHRPIACVGFLGQESCKEYNLQYWGYFQKIIPYLYIDYHIQAHVHLYERFTEDVYWNDEVDIGVDFELHNNENS